MPRSSEISSPRDAPASEFGSESAANGAELGRKAPSLAGLTDPGRADRALAGPVGQKLGRSSSMNRRLCPHVGAVGPPHRQRALRSAGPRGQDSRQPPVALSA